MKKFVFSAVAMMAFSVGSMANTIESEELVNLADLTTAIEKNESFPCTRDYMSNGQALQELGFQEETAWKIARAIFEDCLEALYG